MLNELLSVTANLPALAVAAGGPDIRPVVHGTGVAASQPVAEARPAVDPGQALDRASRAAARAMFPDHDVEVTSFRDEGSNRLVYRVADRETGRVLVQSPPDALLRFYASAREAMAEPLVAVEA